MGMGRTFTRQENIDIAVETIRNNPGNTAGALFCGKNLRSMPGSDIRNRRRIGTMWDDIRDDVLACGVFTEGHGRGVRYYFAGGGNPVHTPKAVQILPDEAWGALTPPMPNRANQHYPLSDLERETLIADISNHVHSILTLMGVDLLNDHNSSDTPHRVAKMWVQEIMAGRFGEPPCITSFPNVDNLRQMVLSGPIRFVSLCSHHWMPIEGEAYVAYIPGSSVVGLSKMSRIVEFYARRPQIQEEMTQQVADHLSGVLPDAWGVAVMVRASHGCMTCRGVNDPHTHMTTSEMRGAFMNNPAARREFFDLCNASRGN